MQLSRRTEWGVMLSACLAVLAVPAHRRWTTSRYSSNGNTSFNSPDITRRLRKASTATPVSRWRFARAGPHVDSAKATAAGEADFGVCTASVLLDRAQGRNLIVLGVIFQHSAATLLVPRRAGITTLSELKGRRLMDTPGSDDIAAMLQSRGRRLCQLAARGPQRRSARSGTAARQMPWLRTERTSPSCWISSVCRTRPSRRAVMESTSTATAFVPPRGRRTANSERVRAFTGGQPEGLAIRTVAQGRDRRSDPAKLLPGKEPRRPAVRGNSHRSTGPTEFHQAWPPERAALEKHRGHLSRPRHIERRQRARMR